MERAELNDAASIHPELVEAFSLGAKIKRREEGRWEIMHVLPSVRERDRQIGTGAPIQKQYAECFDKSQINQQQPVALVISRATPLLGGDNQLSS